MASTVPQSGIASSTGAAAAAGGGFDHAFDDIAGLGGLLGLIDSFGDQADDEDENRRAQDRADDLVPLEGIHRRKLP